MNLWRLSLFFILLSTKNTDHYSCTLLIDTSPSRFADRAGLSQGQVKEREKITSFMKGIYLLN